VLLQKARDIAETEDEKQKAQTVLDRATEDLTARSKPLAELVADIREKLNKIDELIAANSI
jgi:uncharacterized protein YoxC